MGNPYRLKAFFVEISPPKELSRVVLKSRGWTYRESNVDRLPWLPEKEYTKRYCYTNEPSYREEVDVPSVFGSKRPLLLWSCERTHVFPPSWPFSLLPFLFPLLFFFFSPFLFHSKKEASRFFFSTHHRETQAFFFFLKKKNNHHTKPSHRENRFLFSFFY